METTEMKITAQQVNELRKKTGAGMMDCKKALTEADGDMEKAIEILRKKGAAVASKRAEKSDGESKKDEKETKEVKNTVNAEKNVDEKKEETVKDEKSKDVNEVKEDKSSSDSE